MKMLAELYAAEGLRGRAAEWLVRAHRGDPKDAPPQVRFEIGMHFFEAHRADEASEWLGAVAQRDPQYAEAQAALARLYRAGRAVACHGEGGGHVGAACAFAHSCPSLA